ncbi:MAG TPA: LytTR family DNA-binding domain-containing protein [Niabella sp.]|nr:LytTR family DNA-binding domain-containing protein [Niabella sp.]
MEPPIRYISIDDNLLDQLMLQEYASSFSFLKNAGYYNTPGEGLVAVKELKPDLVFLDIEMPELTGVELLRAIRQQVPVAIFITSHPEFALNGFELSAFDYILKPLTEERFAATAKRLHEYWTMKQKAAAYEVLFERASIVIKEGHQQVKLPIHEIIYLEAMQDYTKVVTEKKNYLTLTTLTGFLEKLPAEQFLRVHRSYAVACYKINRIAGNSIICGDRAIPIGKTYRTGMAQLKL